MLLGVSATGNTQDNIGSGNYFIYGAGSVSPSVLNIGNNHDVCFYADATLGVTSASARTIAEFLNSRQITKLVVFFK